MTPERALILITEEEGLSPYLSARNVIVRTVLRACAEERLTTLVEATKVCETVFGDWMDCQRAIRNLYEESKRGSSLNKNP